MEGALTRVAGYVGLTRKKADLDTVQRLLRDILREENLSRITIEAIQKRSLTTTIFEWPTCFREGDLQHSFPPSSRDVSFPHPDRTFPSGDRKYLRRS